MGPELATLDATAQADLVRRGEVTPGELIDAAIARIEKLDPRLNAVIIPLFDQARARASGSLPDGPFRGVPFLLKDLDAYSANDPFHGGTRFLKAAGWVADQDSYLVERFRAAGFVNLGKTNTPEFGLHVTTEPESYGPSRNPWNPEHSTGGSSGGSAAAVASGMVPAAHASDGGGSIRIPASECGLVGLKPSRGRISLGPHYGEYWHGLVISHVVTRSVRDTAAILDAVAGTMPGDPYTAPPAARAYSAEVGAAPGCLRVGILQHVPSGVSTLHPDCIAAVEQTGKVLRSLGHAVEESHPAALAETEPTTIHFTTLTTSWLAAALAYWGEKLGRAIGPDDVEPATWAFVEMGRSVTASQYINVVQELHAYSRRMASWWADGFDVLVTPTLGEPPPKIGRFAAPRENPLGALAETLGLIPFTPPFNITGQPAISLPLHWSGASLPIGVQLVGAYGREDVLIRIAAQLEQVRPWKDRRPPIHA
jgi:amidase